MIKEEIATHNDFIQWTKYCIKALNYLDTLNSDEWPFHTKVKKFIDSAKHHFASPLEVENQEDSPKKHIISWGVDSLMVEYINTAAIQKAYQMSDNHTQLRPPDARIEVPSPTLMDVAIPVTEIFPRDTSQSQHTDYNSFQIDTVQIGEATNTAKLLDFLAYDSDDSDCSSFQDYFEPIPGPHTKCL